MEDLERVIAAMRRVVERLQGENDQLKKTVGAGGPQYGDVIKENKRLKVRSLLFLVWLLKERCHGCFSRGPLQYMDTRPCQSQKKLVVVQNGFQK